MSKIEEIKKEFEKLCEGSEDVTGKPIITLLRTGWCYDREVFDIWPESKYELDPVKVWQFIEEQILQAKREAIDELTIEFIGSMPHPAFIPAKARDKAIDIVRMFQKAKETYLKSLGSEQSNA